MSQPRFPPSRSLLSTSTTSTRSASPRDGPKDGADVSRKRKNDAEWTNSAGASDSHCFKHERTFQPELEESLAKRKYPTAGKRVYNELDGVVRNDLPDEEKAKSEVERFGKIDVFDQDHEQLIELLKDVALVDQSLDKSLARKLDIMSDMKKIYDQEYDDTRHCLNELEKFVNSRPPGVMGGATDEQRRYFRMARMRFTRYESSADKKTALPLMASLTPSLAVTPSTQAMTPRPPPAMGPASLATPPAMGPASLAVPPPAMTRPPPIPFSIGQRPAVTTVSISSSRPPPVAQPHQFNPALPPPTVTSQIPKLIELKSSLPGAATGGLTGSASVPNLRSLPDFSKPPPPIPNATVVNVPPPMHSVTNVSNVVPIWSSMPGHGSVPSFTQNVPPPALGNGMNPIIRMSASGDMTPQPMLKSGAFMSLSGRPSYWS